jgi:hypothetical protein
MLQRLFDAVPHTRKVHAPTLYDIVAEDYVLHYSYNVSFDTAPNYNIVTLHTSGNDLPIRQGEPLVKTTLSYENALCLLPCFHVSPS